ncbi:hypothetical protein [Chryseobacterium carnipullorum]|nr:hypothetical protein [Chryseobacterium carnipullorum]
MKKHLIIHGDTLSGKSLFIDILFSGNENIWRVNCRSITVMEDQFLFDFPGEFVPEIIHFTDVNINIPLDFFYNYLGQIVVNRRFRELFVMDTPILVIEYSEEFKNIPEDGSFVRRFDVINTNTIPYKELIQYLNHNKNTGFKCSVCGWNNCHCLNCGSQRKSSAWFNKDLCFDCASITSENTTQ